MNKLWAKLRMASAFLALVRNPQKTEKIFKMADSGRRSNQELGMLAMKATLENPEFRSLWVESHNPLIEIASLRQFQKGTFGRAVADFLDQNDFTPNGFPKLDTEAPLDYLSNRMRQTHDLWHVLTGYGPSVPDELALQAFTLAQVGSPLSALIIAAGILHLLLYRPLDVTETFSGIIEGFKRGKACKPLATMRLESFWSSDLTLLRSDLGLMITA